MHQINADVDCKTLSQFPALREFSTAGKPIWGTCAGLIFLADRASGENFQCLVFLLLYPTLLEVVASFGCLHDYIIDNVDIPLLLMGLRIVSVMVNLCF